MVRHVFLGVLLAMATVGCDRQKDPFLREVEKESDRAIRRLRDPNVRNPFYWVDKLIGSETNRSTRATCLRIFQDRLCAVRLSGDDYKQQCLIFGDVWPRLMPYRWSESGRWTIEDECNAKVRQFGWMRRELDRWKAMVDNGEAARLKKENLKKFESWRRAYLKCLSDYESTLPMFEQQFEGRCRSYNATAEERARAKALVEAFLGRPMRTKDEVRRDMRERKMSDEMRALQ